MDAAKDDSICVFTSVSPVSRHAAAEQLKQKRRYRTTPMAETPPSRDVNLSFAYAKQSGSICEVVGDVLLLR